MAELHVVMYHYVRDLPRTRFPRIKGMLVDDFRNQVRTFAGDFEMATLEAALEFLRGTYKPRRDLCLMTFDDGLKEHNTEVMPILAEHKVQGLFGVVTGCIEEQRVASVHMNHFLTASLDFTEYRDAFLADIEQVSPGLLEQIEIDPAVAQRSYPLDTREMAMFKLMVNFKLHPELRDGIIGRLFSRYCGDEQAFARELYMSWGEVRQLQENGMLVAGHTHTHCPLSTFSDEDLRKDVTQCRTLLDARVNPQSLWPFSYPYGKRNSYDSRVISMLAEFGYDCAFGTEAGHNVAGSPLFEICRVDCNGAIEALCGNNMAAAS